MNAIVAQKSLDQVLAAIAALDLDPIKVKLMHEESGEGWTREYADRMEREYRRFLELMVKYPDEAIAPSMDVDEFWHYHILDTMKYAEDCQNVFGYFLHHFPYIGLRGKEDLELHHAAGENMHRLYEREYGEPMPGVAAKEAAFSMASQKAAFSMASQKTAFSMAQGTAFSMASQKTAFSMASQKAAFSMAQKPAFSMASQKAAFSMAQKPAFSMASQKAAFSMASQKAAFSMAADKVNMVDRPTLPAVAE